MSDQTKSYYDQLGVSPTATQSEIRAAYLTKVKKTHPDKGGEAAEFRKVDEAYKTLGNSSLRQQYDALYKPTSSTTSERTQAPAKPADLKAPLMLENGDHAPSVAHKYVSPPHDYAPSFPVESEADEPKFEPELEQQAVRPYYFPLYMIIVCSSWHDLFDVLDYLESMRIQPYAVIILFNNVSLQHYHGFIQEQFKANDAVAQRPSWIENNLSNSCTENLTPKDTSYLSITGAAPAPLADAVMQVQHKHEEVLKGSVDVRPLQDGQLLALPEPPTSAAPAA